MGLEVGHKDDEPTPITSKKRAPEPRADREVVITWLAVLNTATAILSSGYRECTPEDVLGLAWRLELWATREV